MFVFFRPFSPNPTANNSPQQPMTGPQTGLLPTPPQHPYPNIRAYGQPSQPQHSSFNTGLLPMPSNHSYPQRFGSHPRPQQQNSSYPATNQSYSHNYTQSVPQPVPQPVPKPVPQPVPPPPQHLSQAPPLPVPAPVGNPIRPQMVKIKIEADIQKQQKEEESKIASILSDGMENRVQNDSKGFYCLFCEIFCQNLLTAERHVDSPKHQRVSHFSDYVNKNNA